MLSRIIVVTGAGGTVGLSLVKHFAKSNKNTIHAIEYSEAGCVPLLELSRTHKNIHIFPADVRDDTMMYMALDGADNLIHCAAMKRVDLGNFAPEEIAKQNVDSFVSLARMAKIKKVKRFLFCSTDKTTKPTSVMGASKLLLEKIVHFASDENTHFAAVRFGNILGSTGSVIPRMVYCALHDQKIYLTDRYMTRYVMTNDQVVQLINFAMGEMRGGEIYCPILPAVRIQRIAEIVRNIIEIKHGHRINIEITGNKLEENIHETMMTNEEYAHAKSKGKFVCIYTKKHTSPFPYDLKKRMSSSSFGIINKEKTFELVNGYVLDTLRYL